MPPKPKITKDMILNTVLKITREMGFEAVNARSVAGRLECSTRPIFTCYKNMEELKKVSCNGQCGGPSESKEKRNGNGHGTCRW